MKEDGIQSPKESDFKPDLIQHNPLKLMSTRHCKYQSGHYFVWITAKQRKIFENEEIIIATEKYIIEAIENNGMTLIAIEVNKTPINHIRVFVSFPPRMSASQAINVMKGYSSRRLRIEFPWLKSLPTKKSDSADALSTKQTQGDIDNLVRQDDKAIASYGMSQLWARSYYWGTAGNVSTQAIEKYIEAHGSANSIRAVRRRLLARVSKLTRFIRFLKEQKLRKSDNPKYLPSI